MAEFCQCLEPREILEDFRQFADRLRHDDRARLHHSVADGLCHRAPQDQSWKIFTFYLLATTTAPIQLYIFPLYFGFAKLRLINNIFGVALIYTALYSPFAVMLLRTYFLAVPKELEEAAIVDGATHWQVFWRVMLPIVSPGILTVALIIGLNSWNEFLIATTFLQKQENMTAVIAFFLLSGQYSSDWGEIMAAALIIVVPVVALFVFMQKRFIEGMAGGSVKG